MKTADPTFVATHWSRSADGRLVASTQPPPLGSRTLSEKEYNKALADHHATLAETAAAQRTAKEATRLSIATRLGLTPEEMAVLGI